MTVSVSRRHGSSRRLLAAALGVLCALPGAALPQSATSPKAETSVFASGTAAVLLDLVIREKSGRPVLDVKPEEVEVLEDGVRQKIDGFRWVQTESLQVEGAPPPASRPDPSKQINLVSFVFDQLGIEGRKLANKAALSFLEKGLRPNTFMAVFQIDQRLALLQPFTNDASLLKAAINSATSNVYKGLTDDQAAMARAEEDLAKAEAGASGSSSGGAFAARAQAQALVNMLRMSSTLQRQQLGTTSLYPLLALVRGHETLAGRKSLLYISEGLQVPPNLEQVFRSTISAANRANVSIYAVDARGLSSENDLTAAGDALTEARRASFLSNQRRGGAVTQGEVKLADTAEDALRLNVKGTLGDIAEETGGFLIANTNDFKKGAERLASDLSGYYEVTYMPPPAPYDGRFRAIEVKVARKGVVVQNRSGYFAVPAGSSSAMFAYEVPLLGALALDPPPRDFDIRAGALHFEEGPSGLEHRLVVIVEVPIASLRVITDETRKTYGVHFSLLAVVRRDGGAVVERFSEDYPFTGPLDKAEALKLGNIVLKRRFALTPDRYTLEVAGQDRGAGRTAVSRQSFVVPSRGEGVPMSSLTLIRRIEPVTAGTDKAEDPLDVGGARIVPNLDLPISAAANPKLSLFFIAYPPEGGEPPRMTLEFSRDGRILARAEPVLPAPEADGKIRYVGTFPTQRFTPGRYEVRVALARTAGTSEETTAFTIVP